MAAGQEPMGGGCGSKTSLKILRYKGTYLSLAWVYTVGTVAVINYQKYLRWKGDPFWRSSKFRDVIGTLGALVLCCT